MLKEILGAITSGAQSCLPAGAHFVSLATAIVLLLGAPSVTRAEEPQSKEEFPDRFMIRGTLYLF